MGPMQPDEEAPEPNEVQIPEVVEIPLETMLDLHPFRPSETRAVVTSYLEEAQARGWTEVRLVHGRGRGVQRRSIQALLARHPDVLEFADAPAERGGWGATVVRLRVKRE